MYPTLPAIEASELKPQMSKLKNSCWALGEHDRGRGKVEVFYLSSIVQDVKQGKELCLTGEIEALVIVGLRT